MEQDQELNGLVERNGKWMDELKQKANQTSQAYDELREIGAREDLEKLMRRQDADDSMTAAIAVTPDGGRLSSAQIKALNARRGMKVDGGGVQSGQLMDAGFNPKTGGYEFVFASVDDAGNVSYQPKEISQTELYGMMSGRPEWFGAERIKNAGAAIQKADPSYTDDRLRALGTVYADRRSALQDKIMNAQANLSGRSGGFGASFGQRVKLEEMKRDRQLGFQQMKNDGRSNERQLKELMAIKDFVDNNQDKMDESMRTHLMGAYQNGIIQIAGKYAQKPESGGDGGPSVGEDGILRLPNGKTIRKDQEYTNPQDGKKYIWRGGDARNWEPVE